jgi:hypothetical protein
MHQKNRRLYSVLQLIQSDTTLPIAMFIFFSIAVAGQILYFLGLHVHYSSEYPNATPLKNAGVTIIVLVIVWAIFQVVDKIAGFWWRDDKTSFWKKGVWFLSFWLWPYGFLVYYFIVYRPRRREEMKSLSSPA